MTSEMRLTEEYAAAQDRVDPLARFRSQFEIPTADGTKPVVYLTGNSLGLMPKEARTAVNDELDDWARLGVDGHMNARRPWYSYHELFREAGARLVGAKPGEVVMMNSLTVNLHLMLASFYRPRGKRTRILIEGGAFPSDRYAVMSQAAWHGVPEGGGLIEASPREGEDVLRTDDLVGLIAERGEEIAVVLLSGVQFFTGQWFDMERITKAAHEQGCTVGFDLAHAAGNVPMGLHDWGVDFAVWCSYKYLNAGPGAVAGCYVHDRHGRDPRVKRLAGWWGNEPATRFDMDKNIDFVPRLGADGWQLSNPPIFAMAPLRASLEMFDSVGINAVREKSVRLTAYLEWALRQVFDDRFSIITPEDPAARGCQLSIRMTQGAEDLSRALTARGVVVDHRKPDVIRLAPTPFYNTFHDVWRVAMAFRDALVQSDLGNHTPASASAPPS